MTSRITSSLALPGLVAAAVVGLAVLPGSAASQATSPTTVVKPPAAPAATAVSEDAAGEALLKSACSSCHDVGMVTSQRKTPDAWTETMSRMIAHGAPISDEQADKILDYLTKAYPAP